MRRDSLDLASSITARQLHVPIAEAVTFQRQQSAADALAVLVEASFDHAPAVKGDGRVIGYVKREDLADPGTRYVGDVSLDVQPDLLVSADAGVGELLGGLQATRMLFVLDGREIKGFITPSDLNKQPGRSYFFLLLVEFELGLAELVRRTIGPDRAFESLPEYRRAKLMEAAIRARKDDVYADWVAYFVLDDLLMVTSRSEELRRSIKIASQRVWDKRTRDFARVRNAVAHPVNDLVNAKRTPAHLQRVDQELRAVTARIESALDRAR